MKAVGVAIWRFLEDNGPVTLDHLLMGINRDARSVKRCLAVGVQAGVYGVDADGRFSLLVLPA